MLPASFGLRALGLGNRQGKRFLVFNTCPCGSEEYFAACPADISWCPGRNHSLTSDEEINPLNPELNPICYLLALLAHDFLRVSRIRVKSLTIRLLMSYIYMERLFLMFLDHTQRRSTVGRTPLDE